MSKALHLTKVRTLDIVAPSRRGRPRFVTSASGLVVAGGWRYVVADDELHLGVFRGRAPGRLVRIFEGTLSLTPRKRKRQKPDLEALALLPGASLLALPSGSRRPRAVGARIALERDGSIAGPSIPIDFSPLHQRLRETFDELNLEGAAVVTDRLVILQRGNGAARDNAIVTLDLTQTLARLTRERRVTAGEIRDIGRVDLGEVGGVPLSFTDACGLPDGSIAFVAAAEACDSTYEDGPCAGSAFGVVGRDGGLVALRPITGPGRRPVKAEGLWIDRGRVWIVTDADDPAVPSALYEGRP
jgi:hypothetical protein